MNKTELIDAIAEDTCLLKKEINLFINSFTENVSNALEKGEKMQLLGFGTFEIFERTAREGRNPKTGEKIKIKSIKNPKFKAGKNLKDRVNK